MKTPLIARATPVATSESPHFLVVDGHSAATAQAAEIKSRAEPSKVVRFAFGEWPVPTVLHPDTMTIDDFVEQLKEAGHGALITEARREISTWFDAKTTLRSLRLAAGLSQSQLAALMNTSQSQIARIESGRQELTTGTIKRLATALNVTPHRVFDAASE